MRLMLAILLTLTICRSHVQIDLVNRSSQQSDSAFLFQGVGNRLEKIEGGFSNYFLYRKFLIVG